MAAVFKQDEIVSSGYLLSRGWWPGVSLLWDFLAVASLLRIGLCWGGMARAIP